MVDLLVIGVVGSCVVATVLAGVSALRDRRPTLAVVVLVALAELLLIAQSVVIGVVLAMGNGPQSPLIVVAYLVGVLAVGPFGLVWALGERSRWGNVVLVVTAVTMATMTLRLWDLW